jgi:hypothetical protein
MEQWNLHPKTKMVSMLASDHNFTAGHAVRHASRAAIRTGTYGGNTVDHYGRGTLLVDNPLEALRDYRYSIVVENSNEDFYFTDKLILCFTVGTIPIFWGLPSIHLFFDMEGIITFKDPSELPDIVASLTVEDYERRRPAMLKNMEKAKELYGWDDYIYEQHKYVPSVCVMYTAFHNFAAVFTISRSFDF